MTADRVARLVAGLVIAGYAGLVLLTLWIPEWEFVRVDRKENLPTFSQSALLAVVTLLALEVLRLEARALTRTGQSRWWTVTWLGMAGLFGYISLDEAILIHQRFNTDEFRAWLPSASPLQHMVVWLPLFLPLIVGAVVFLLASLGARARLSPRLVAWGGAGLAVWIFSLVLEGTAKSFFIPRNLFQLEVMCKETVETLGATLWGWAIWRYRMDLRTWLAAPPPGWPRFAVPWRGVAAGTLAALGIPAAIVGGAIALSPRPQKLLADRALQAGRLDEAVRVYHEVLARAPNYVSAWDGLGIAEFHLGHIEAAEQTFATAERLAPRSAVLPNHRGATLLSQGRYAEAVEAFARAIALAPADAELHRNLGIALHHLGREVEAEAAFHRAESLGLSRLGVAALSVSLPANLPLVYVAHPQLEAALRHTLAGRSDAAVREYRRVVEAAPELAAAHLGLANELFRWSVAQRLTQGLTPVRVRDAEIEPVRPSVLFMHWVRHTDGHWQDIEATVEPAVLEGAVVTARREAREHYQRALALGAGAAAHLGLALLAREEGRPAEATSHLAEARALDPGLPALDRSRGKASSLEYGDSRPASKR